MIEQGHQAIQPVTSNDDGLNMHLSLIRSITDRIATATLVVVKKVDDVKKTINALPMVSQVDGFGKPVSQAIIYNIPYLPLQYGANAILMTPAIGDIGLCVFCHQDISGVKATKKESLPGSYRKHSYSDGFYLGGILNPNPIQYIEFKDGNINIKATTINITGDVETTGTLKNNGVNVGSTHVHSDLQGGNTGVPH